MRPLPRPSDQSREIARRLLYGILTVDEMARTIDAALAEEHARSEGDDEVTSLSEFLLARIAEDEAVARQNTGDRGLGDEGFFPDYRTYSDADTTAADDFLHHMTPARVLAECDAKRRIVELHSAEAGQHPDFCGHDLRKLPCTTLRLLALPYADHPDYREEWRP